MSRKLTALGANIFAGLFTKGVKDAGFEVLGQLEHGPYGVKTARLNFPKMDIRVGRENWREQEFKGKVDFVYSNPPCAAFSNARGSLGGSWETQKERLRYIYDCVELALNVKPKAFAMESVLQAWTRGHSFILQQCERLMDAGYHATVLLQDNQFMGVPQARRRLFVIGHQYPLAWPRMTKTITVGEALAKAGPPIDDGPTPFIEKRPLHRDLWKKAAKFGGNFRKAFEVHGRRGLTGGVPSFLVSRLRVDEPAPVMIHVGVRHHPTENRLLLWHEWLALVGLPRNWRSAEAGMNAATAELARAVMPPVGKWLGRAVADGIALGKLKTRPQLTVVDMRGGPDEEPIIRVEQIYEGFTQKVLVPPPIPPLEVKEERAPRAPRAGGPKKPGSGQRICELLLEGLETEAILKKIHKEFPGSKATGADVSWNKGRLRREGKWKEKR